MKTCIRNYSLLALAACCLMAACDTPFGLGSKVNTGVPVISNVPKADVPGDPYARAVGGYLFGSENKIYFDVEQEFGIQEVYMNYSYRLKGDGPNAAPRPGKVYAELLEDGRYVFNLDARAWADGVFKAIVTAVDTSGNETTTTELIYTIKNAPPQVEMTLPKIKGGDFAAPDLNDPLKIQEIIQGSDLMGIASDLMGIKSGYPEIMFWPVSAYPSGVPPDSDAKWGQWRPVVDDKWKPLAEDGVKAAQFRWPLTEMIQNSNGTWRSALLTDSYEWLPIGSYRFKVRVMDLNGTLHTYPDLKAGSTTEPPASPNEYVEIKLKATTNPIIKFGENFPRYYNGKGGLEAKIVVTAPNGMRTASNAVYAAVTYSDNEVFEESERPNHTGSWINFNVSESIISSGRYVFDISMPAGKLASLSGDVVFHVMAVDSQDQPSIASRAFIIDKEGPALEYLEPIGLGRGSPNVTSTVIFRGFANDNQRVKKMYYALGAGEANAADMTPVARETETTWHDTKLDTGDPLGSLPGTGSHPGSAVRAFWSGSLSSWSWRFENIADVCGDPGDGSGPANSFPYGNYYVADHDHENNLWLLPIKFKVVDIAGNVSFFSVEVIVDPDRDAPRVSISSHSDEQTVGGQVRINGTAEDNEMIHHVVVRITKQSDADCDTANVPTQVVHITGNKDPGKNTDAQGWAKVTLLGSQSSSVSWYHNINSEGELNAPAGKNLRRVLLEFRAADSSIYANNVFKHYGPIQTLSLVIDKTVPVIENVKILRGRPSDWTAQTIAAAPGEAYSPGKTRISEFITLKADIRDDKAITSIRLRSSGQPYAEYIQETAFNNTAPWVVKNAVPDGALYTVYIPINTNVLTTDAGATTFGSGYKDTAGVYSLDIQVADDTTPTPYTAQNTFSLQIDNYYPMTDYRGNLNAVGNYIIEGEAWDTGSGISVEGIERIVVYFTKKGGSAGISLDGSVYNSNPQKALTGRNGNYQSAVNPGTPATLANFPNVRQLDGTFATTSSGIVIDNTGFADGYTKNFSGTTYVSWSVRYNTVLLDDGPVIINYVVFDKAGNATHNSREIYIANNRPEILTISLGTDLNADGDTLDSGEYVPKTVNALEDAKANFRVRNNRFHLKLDFFSGNGSKNYRVSYVLKSANPVPVSSIIKGNVYTIANLGTSVNWVNYGLIGRPADIGVTFVATGSYSDVPAGGSGGTVYTYTAVGGNTNKSGPVAANVTEISFESSSFGSALIPDSANKVQDIYGNIIMRNDRYFMVKVYDSTILGGAEADQLAHAVPIRLDIDNDDSILPIISINPLYWENVSNNSLYQYSKASGHIELESDLPPAFNQAAGLRDNDPKVSGKVSFRGTSFDNNSIGEIWFRIANFSDSGATSAAFSGSTYYRAAFYNGSWAAEDRFAGSGWKFSVESETLDQAGHRVNWRLDFDSRFIANAASVDNAFTVLARDRKPVTPNESKPGSTQTAAAAKTSYYRFDVVPYISNISTAAKRITGGLKDSNIRSANGRYSIIQGTDASFITVTGFNLPAGTGSARILTTAERNAHEGDPNVIPAGTNLAFINGAADRSSIQLANNSAKSGYLTVITNNIPTLNNINSNGSLGSFVKITSGTNASNGYNEENMPNREADRYVTKNITLTDDRYLQFCTVKETDVKNGYYPVMIMNGDNPVFGYINPKGGPDANPAAGGGGGAGSAHSADARPQRAEFNYANGAAMYKEYLIKMLVADQMAMAVDSQGRYGHYTVYNYSNGGSEYIYDRYAELWGNQGYGWANGSTYFDWPNSTNTGRYRSYDSNNTAMSFETPMTEDANVVTQLDRFLYPKLIIKGDSINSYAANYLAYFDDGTTDRQLIFRTFQVGTNTVGRTNRLSYTGAQYDSQNRRYDTFTNYNPNGVIGNAGRNTAATSASRYFDMGVLSDNRVVIVYFDESLGRLRIRYSNNTIDGSAPIGVTFSENTNITLPEYVGMYVSMFIDTGNRIHIAAFNSLDSELQYIFIPSYNANTYRTAKIDQFGSVGYWTDIKIHQPTGTPYIAYYNSAESGGRDSIKLAYAKNGITSIGDVKGGVDANGYTTGNWEYMTVPALQPPQGGNPGFQKVNLGFQSGGRWMLGYLGTNIEFSYPVGE